MNGDASLLLETLFSVGRHGAAYLWITTSLAAVLGALTWWGFYHLGTQVNTRFHMRPLHHFCCGLAAAVTVIAVFLFAGLNFAEYVTEQAIDNWAHMVKKDDYWRNHVFREAYDAVYEQKDKLGLDFSKYPHPDQGGGSIPRGVGNNGVDDIVSEIYVKEMVRNFKNNHSFLAKILWPQSGEGEKRLIGDMNNWFEQNKGSYRLDRGVELLQQILCGDLQTKIPRVIWISRIVLVVVFLLIQGGLGALIAHAALADIRVRRAQRLGERME